MLVYIIIISIIALLFMYALYKAAVVKLRTRKKNIIEQLVISKECAYGKDKDAFDEIIAIVRSKRKPSPAFCNKRNRRLFIISIYNGIGSKTIQSLF